MSNNTYLLILPHQIRFFIIFFFNIRRFFNGFIEKLQGEISSFLTGMACPHPFVLRNNIAPFLHKVMYALHKDINIRVKEDTLRSYELEGP